MKAFYSFVLLFGSCAILQAQQPSGTIRYKESITMEVKMDIPEGQENSPAMKTLMEQMAKPNESEKILYFDATQSVYRDYEDPHKKDKKQTVGNHEMEFFIMIEKEELISHRNHQNNVLTESRNIMDKTFIVTDTAKKVKWKMTTETDTIANYRCIKATCMKDTILIQAWFATDLKTSTGPANYFGLPGTILKLDVNKGKHIIEATQVDVTAPAPENLTAPKKGKKVTRKQYDEIMRKKMAERQELEGGNGNGSVIIDIH